jgi:outer membrane protein assembly factor BamB
MAAPVGLGDLILAPVNVGGSIWVYAMNPRRGGELVWRSYLCDEPGGGSDAWSPIQLTVDGSSVYAVCGTGVVFALDAMTGMIRFARRYPRTGEPNNMMERFGNEMELLDLDGWQEDIAIPAGDVLLVFASDYNAIWAINQQTAEFVWRTDNRPFGAKFDYLIGVSGDYVYVGGRDTIGAISLQAQGRWEWVYSLPEASSGRAMLTTDAIYVPLGSSIQKLGLRGRNGDGEVMGTFPVVLGTGAPIGNLFSDGEKIWVSGGNRLYVLGDDDGSIVTKPGDEVPVIDEDSEDDEEIDDAGIDDR